MYACTDADVRGMVTVTGKVRELIGAWNVVILVTNTAMTVQHYQFLVN